MKLDGTARYPLPRLTDFPLGDQPRAIVPAARTHSARGLISARLRPPRVMDLPKEVPRSAACDALAPGGATSFYVGLSFSGDFLEIFNTAIEYRFARS